MHRGRFEGTAGPRRRRATRVRFRVEPQAVGRARERVRRDRGARVRRHGKLGHLGPSLQRHGSGAGDESCEGRDAHLHCNCTLCSQCSYSSCAALVFQMSAGNQRNQRYLIRTSLSVRSMAGSSVGSNGGIV